MEKIEGTSGKSFFKSTEASSRLPAARGRGKISQKVNESTSWIKSLPSPKREKETLDTVVTSETRQSGKSKRVKCNNEVLFQQRGNANLKSQKRGSTFPDS